MILSKQKNLKGTEYESSYQFYQLISSKYAYCIILEHLKLRESQNIRVYFSSTNCNKLKQMYYINKKFDH